MNNYYGFQNTNQWNPNNNMPNQQPNINQYPNMSPNQNQTVNPNMGTNQQNQTAYPNMAMNQPNQTMNQGGPMNQQNQTMMPSSNPQPNPNNNLNFNKCNYDQKAIQPNDLFDSYNGFIRGNMFPDLFNQYKLTRPYDIEPLNEQAQLLTYVDGLSFAAHDLNLYLDTHPDDKSMIGLYNQYRDESERAIKQYEEMFGPLFVSSEATNTFPWAWNQLPWPWENK